MAGIYHLTGPESWLYLMYLGSFRSSTVWNFAGLNSNISLFCSNLPIFTELKRDGFSCLIICFSYLLVFLSFENAPGLSLDTVVCSSKEERPSIDLLSLEIRTVELISFPYLEVMERYFWIAKTFPMRAWLTNLLDLFNTLLFYFSFLAC